MASVMRPWRTATAESPRTRPNIMALLGAGATSVSLRKPNSLSHMTDVPEKKEVKKTLIMATPGTTKSVKLRPLRAALTAWPLRDMDQPRPKKNSHMKGLMKLMATLAFILRKALTCL